MTAWLLWKDKHIHYVVGNKNILKSMLLRQQEDLDNTVAIAIFDGVVVVFTYGLTQQ